MSGIRLSGIEKFISCLSLLIFLKVGTVLFIVSN
ncbi:MAG: hypothetical protein ACI9RP_001662 [Cyclobacteriaceae bacterium]|jgi:hypothetical protein